MIKFLDLKHQYLSIKPEIDQVISDIINESAFIGGKFVKKFEEDFAKYQDAKFCVSVANGTDALEIAIESLNLPKGSEIIVPANSFIATSEAVTRNNLKVIFCDCNPDNYSILISDLKNKITSKTKAIIAVHLYGHPADMTSINQIAKENNLRVIEDSAQAHSAEHNGKRVGAIGDIGTFSFYPGKNLGAYGDGGAITTNNKELAEKCRMIANHGRIEKYNHVLEGRNSRLDALQAGILNVKLKYLDAWVTKRNLIASYYLDNLSNLGDIVLAGVAPFVTLHAYHLFVIRTNQRDQLKNFLQENNIETGIHYPIALPKLKAYAYLNQSQTCINACSFDDRLLSLPIGEHLTEDEIETIVKKVKLYFKR